MAKKKKYEEVYEQLIQARNLNTSDEVAKAEKYVNENRPGPKTVNFPVKSSTYRKKLEELTKEKALANIALRQGDIAGTNKFKSVTEKYNKEYLPTSQKYNEEKDKEEAETISKTSEKDLANIDRYNKGANVSDSNIGKVFEYADAVKELRKEGYTIDDIKNIASGRKRQTNATEMAEKEKESAEFAAEHKVLSSILSVPQSVVGGVTGSASAAAQFILDPFRKIDTNEAAFTGSNEASAIRNEVSKDMSPLGRFIYETGMSLTDSLAGGLLGRAAKLGKAGSQFMMGSMSMENTIQDVTERGGTPEQALFSGFANGFFEGFFEEFSLGKLIKLSEGGSKGLKQIAKDIGSSVLVNASEEAATEFSSIMYDTLMNGGISNSVLKIQEYMGQGMTEEEAKSTVARDFAIQIGQAGIGGALAGGALGGAGTVAGKINNRPNDNDNKVIEKETQERAKDKRKTVAIENEVNKRISESEEVNGVLSDTEKNNIRKAVEADVESGKFDVTTTELSTKEFDEIRKQVRNDLENGKISLKRVEETLFPEKAQRFNELIEELKKADEDQRESIENELKNINNDISKIIGSSKHLSKSYEQEMLKNTAFKRETSADDTELTKLLDKSVARAGLNDTPEAHDTYNLLNKVANDSGTEYVFTSNKELEALGYNLKGRTVNGLVRTTKDGKTRVLVNIDSNNALNVIVGHETTHLLENTELYDKLKNHVIDYAKEKGDYDSRLEELTELYKDTNANVEEELVADLIGEYVFTDEAFVKNLSAKQPNIFQRIYNHIKHLIKMATAGSKEAKQLEQIKNTFDKAYKEMGKASEADSDLTTEADSDIKYSKNNSNIEPEKLYEGRELSKDKEIYNYDFLTSLPAIKKAQLPKIKEITDDDGKVSREKVLELGRSNAEKVGKVDGEHYKIKNRYTGRDITVTNTTIKHGLNGDNKRLLTNGRVGAIAGEAIQNAVPVNALYDTAPQAVGTYAMAGIATEEGTNKRIVYIITVEQHNDNVSNIETYDVGHSISGRIEKSSLADTKSPGLIPTEAANISIKDFLEIVNNTHKSILSDDVLSHLGETRPKNGYYTDKVKFSLSAPTENRIPVKGYAVYGSDIKLQEDIAPVKETISKTETVENIAPINPNIVKEEPASIEAEPKKVQTPDKPVRPLLRTEMKSISRSIKRSYGSTFDPTKDIMRLYNAMHSGKLTDEEAAIRATEIGKDIADNIKTKQVRTAEAQEVLDVLRNSRIKLDVEQISEVSKMYDGYNNYKQSMFGKVIISKNGIDLDTKWQELSEEYPYIFDPDVNPLEQPQELANIISDLQNSYELQDVPDATEIGIEIYQKYFEVPERRKTHGEIQREKVEAMKEQLAAKGFDLDKILEDAKDKSTFSSVDNTPQRFTEKTFGYKEGQAINEFLGNKVALDEAEGVKWLNTITGKKDGLLAQLSREYNIKPGTKESAAAQMYGEGFFVDEFGDYRRYGDEELAQDFPDFETQNNIKGLANDPRIRKFYNETFDAINESRTRNGYDAIPKRENYFLHFFEMNDFFTLHGIPFNPNDIRKKDLPTELNGMTADLKPGQPYFASANRRMGVNTTYDLLRGIEQYAVSAEPQIYHIDNIQLYRGFRNYIADMYGKTKGLENLGALSEDEQQNRIEKVFDSHLSVYAKHLNEQANILAGKTALIDRGLEGILGRRGITTLNEINRQVGSNMVGFNISSAFTNYLAMVQAMAKLPLKSSIKGFTGLISNKIRSLNGYSDGFVESDPAMIRRKGADQFYRKSWQKVADLGYKLMSATDDMVTEFIVRAKYDELINNGMEDKEAHIKAGEWAMRLLGDRSKGQMPQIFNSKTLGLFTKFQLEVRNQLDSMFYDTNNEAKVSTETIQNERKKNIAKAAKITSTVAQLVIYQHIFGKAFESIAGYNPAFDILGVLITALGFDDDEDSEDTVLDNVEQGFLDLLEDMPYSSVLTGGRIPISQALPIKEVITGKDSYGNDKSRIKTITEAAPYYLMPTGYGQIKKTAKGLAMFDKNNPVSGSYTDSGNLRFPVEDTVLNRIQAGLFGQYANANARDYFDNERAPLKSKQIQEYKDLDFPIADYWKYRDGLKEQKTLEDKFNYIADLDLPVSKKNIMINNIVDREEKVDMTNYDDFSSYEEFDFATKNPEKYSFLESLGVSYKDYKSSEEAKEAYDWAYNNPDKCALAKAAAGDIVTYRNYAAALNDLKADKDSDGKTISGSRKIKVAEYINSLDADYGAKLILYKSEYKSDDQYNYEIIEYLNSRQDISYQEMVEILNTLGFVVDSQGYVRW